MAPQWPIALQRLGLGRVRRRGKSYHYETVGGRSAGEIDRVVTGMSFEAFVNRELNRSFDAGSVPFRPFILSEADRTLVGVVYHHWVADSVSVRLLLRTWFELALSLTSDEKSSVEMAAGGYGRYFLPERAGWKLSDGLLASARSASRFKRVARVEGRSAFDFHSRFLLRESPAGEIHEFRGAARRLGVTVNDLFLSAMAIVCAELAPISRNGKRPDVGLGTIVDLRPSSRVDLSNTFGLFLGFTSVIARPGDLADLSRLIQSIAAQNRLARKTGVAQASPLRMAIGLMMGKVYSRAGSSSSIASAWPWRRASPTSLSPAAG